ncbi:MAG: tRNA preQ1(34) S-adenosylmethionine ribosyltransferase-isomerase QueA [Oligoflexales bacterium]|nr:tRNA preQ1(34) S-adenosylmethionine ribosyltransferase-isomerase QueA [Oligoflexales bacterium]
MDHDTEKSRFTASEYLLEDFQYDLPENLIAQEPTSNRQESRLLCYQESKISHHVFKDLVNLLPESSLVIRNVTKVIPSRLIGKLESGGRIEIFLLHSPFDIDHQACGRAIGRPMKKLIRGQKIFFDHSLVAEVLERPESDVLDKGILVRFNVNQSDLLNWLEQFGVTPLPPYILRKQTSSERDEIDKKRYQTVYAQTSGSVAAPTAGLHFNDEVIVGLRSKNIEIADVILHVGAGTFMPVRHSDLNLHKMHSETYLIPKITYNKILEAKKNNRAIILVGTTTLRALESFFLLKEKDSDKNAEEFCDRWNETTLFIYPKSSQENYRPKIGDALITNFHQPASSLFMLVSALFGVEVMKNIYSTAIAEQYRFFSYGDASLLWLKKG